ncbi:kinase-like domain-containing protein [Astrocystis sublimbata]|nr:kinase-like domain-containing protein [Astrocystis sublimbata]
MSIQSLLISMLNWKTSECGSSHTVRDTIERTNWQTLCQIASTLNHGLPCTLLSNITNGLHNLVRILEFSDQTRWIARISLHRSPADLAKLRSEVTVMQLIKEKSQLPVPHIFAYEANIDNPVGAPFILMEFLPGNTAMDAAGGYEVHKGEIPSVYRTGFHRSVAKCQVQITALRFSKIGTVVRTREGEYEIGPFPDIGGPFDSATTFFAAWVQHLKFPHTEDQILKMMGEGPANRVLAAIKKFPSQLKAVVDQMSCDNYGPFPLCHADFFHSNIVVDENFQILGIIDWEGACTLPLQLVTFPAFLDIMPPLFGSPNNYNKDGVPLDGRQRQRWNDRKGYAQMVQSAELAEVDDHLLSRCLNDEKNLTLAYAMTAYRNGKLGFYDNVLDAL